MSNNTPTKRTNNQPLDFTDKERTFWQYLCMGVKPQDAWVRAGYSEGSVGSGPYLKLKSVNFITKCEKDLEAHGINREVLAKIRLQQINVAEQRLIEEMVHGNDPALIAKYPQFIDREYRLAKVDRFAGDQAPQVINIGEIRNLMISMTNPAEKPDPVQVEAIEVEE